MSLCGAPTEQISQYVDHHLRPLVHKIPSYLKDTTDFLNKLATLDTLSPGCILVTLDVSSLYTNIPHTEGMEACRQAFDICQFPDLPMSYLIHLIELMLTCNNFSFTTSRPRAQLWEPGWCQRMLICLWQTWKNLKAMNSTKPKSGDDILTTYSSSGSTARNPSTYSYHRSISFTQPSSSQQRCPRSTSPSWKMTCYTWTCIPNQLTPTSTYHQIAVIPNTVPPQSHTTRASENLLKKRGLFEKRWNELRDHMLARSYETN